MVIGKELYVRCWLYESFSFQRAIQNCESLRCKNDGYCGDDFSEENFKGNDLSPLISITNWLGKLGQRSNTSFQFDPLTPSVSDLTLLPSFNMPPVISSPTG